ncbi:hypothetical protein SUTMEG_11510 [Sutterella megalosphaeroides]|uniref:Uncharacterized protein n=1 Tax=Sutterella megalosphaeroides TaxID=2494234 RepID=A0A2Z6IBF3_9BURK|nr:hypothetical protein SUTMEG_11510 [Sutterella megalosphaeroides]
MENKDKEEMKGKKPLRSKDRGGFLSASVPHFCSLSRGVSRRAKRRIDFLRHANRAGKLPRLSL